MTNVFCNEIFCINNIGNICQCENIDINLDVKYCGSHEDYSESSDYQEEFWIAYKDTPYSEAVREKRKGKKNELFGLTFYTENDDRCHEECLLTEARTGIACGSLKDIEIHIATIKAKMLSYPAVLDLEIRESNELER